MRKLKMLSLILAAALFTVLYSCGSGENKKEEVKEEATEMVADEAEIVSDSTEMASDSTMVEEPMSEEATAE